MDLAALHQGTEDGYLDRPRVAVDAMGGDHAPEEVVRGAVEWARLHDDVEVILVGDGSRITPFIDEPLPAHVRIVQASQIVGMDEAPALGVRRKRDASINVAMRLVRDGEADAVVTAGHTGAGVASAILNLKRLPGVDRPALAVQMITETGPLTLLDIGATTDSTGVNLAQYAHMGSLFSERVLGVKNPSVALLSIGGEEGKGETRVQDATALLRGGHLNFIGNVEGRDVPHHPADVVVCDASVGNVMMKFFEGISTVIFDMLRAEFKRLPLGPIGYVFMRPAIGRIRERFDYEKLGGSPLLGVNGTVLITHGSARRRMIGYAVEVTAAAARANIPERIMATLASEGVDKSTARKKAAAL
ncbi:MAG: phosphate acyltransferase PlsX, partial [Chloroflexota bacterium]|nr:phosphate acyltransferase PlsX [Chloroflexota bacterium]